MDSTSQYAAAAQRVLDTLPIVSDPDHIDVGNAIVRYARAFLGMGEIGDTNRNDLIDAWARELHYNPGNPWCMIYVQHVYRAVSNAYGKPDLIPHDTAATQSFADYAEAHGLLTIATKCSTPGSLIIFRSGTTNLGHIEIITECDEHYYSSIGGNTSSEFSRDGGDVGEHTHVLWNRFGPVGSERRGQSRWTRGIVPLDRLLRHAWAKLTTTICE